MNIESNSNNRRIAKNTMLLYFRMIFMMGVQLYTSRVVLNTLGVNDYGIYNVVGGIVAMFGFLNSSMTASTQRYITFELGKGNVGRLKQVFATSVSIHIIISLLILILAETVGLWFFYEKMVIPIERVPSALIVYQMSIITTMIAIMSYPFNADIVAHEKMSAFAYISILEATLKLLVVYVLVWGNFDKLELYAYLITSVQVFICLCYYVYCRKRFVETHINISFNKPLFMDMLKFAGWNLWGNLAAILMTQGLNLLLNIYFGPAVNAARAVSVQVQNAIHQFSNNFQMALNPQITKTYAVGDIKNMHKLIFRSSKFTFFLLFTLCLPVFIEAKWILEMWLKIVPDYTVVFLRIMILIMLVDSTSNPLMVSAAATGKVKKYQSIVGGLLLLILPCAYMVLKLGGAPWTVFAVHLAICIAAYFSRLLIIKPLINLQLHIFIKEVIIKCLMVGSLSFIIPFVLHYYILSATTYTSIFVLIISVVSAASCSFYIGLDSHERHVISLKILSSINKLKK